MDSKTTLKSSSSNRDWIPTSFYFPVHLISFSINEEGLSNTSFSTKAKKQTQQKPKNHQGGQTKIIITIIIIMQIQVSETPQLRSWTEEDRKRNREKRPIKKKARTASVRKGKEIKRENTLQPKDIFRSSRSIMKGWPIDLHRPNSNKHILNSLTYQILHKHARTHDEHIRIHSPWVRFKRW